MEQAVTRGSPAGLSGDLRGGVFTTMLEVPELRRSDRIGNLLLGSASVHAESAVMAPTRIMRTLFAGALAFSLAAVWMSVTPRDRGAIWRRRDHPRYHPRRSAVSLRFHGRLAAAPRAAGARGRRLRSGHVSGATDAARALQPLHRPPAPESRRARQRRLASRGGAHDAGRNAARARLSNRRIRRVGRARSRTRSETGIRTVPRR